jgi:tetratricopeptide (TPR) repeat protein
VAIARELAAAAPANVTYRRALSTSRLQLAQALARNGDMAAALTEARVALDLRRAIAEQDPADRQAAIDLMFVQLELGQLLARAGDRPAAAAALQSAADRARKLASADPNYVFYRLTLASALTHLSQVLSALGRHAEAAPHARQALALAEQSAARDPVDARPRFAAALACEAVGDAEPESAQEWYRRSFEMMAAMQKEGVLAGGTLFGDEPGRLAAVQKKAGL